MEHVNLLDRKYANEPVPCPNEGRQVKMGCGVVRDNHGNMAVHNSGAYLVCGLCGANQPIARI